MRRAILLLTLCSSLAACNFDLGLDFGELDWGGGYGGGGGGGGCCWAQPALILGGDVQVGDYDAEPWEATVYFYEPSDTLVPVDSVRTDWQGRYVMNWYDEPTPGICDWVGRAVLWSGEAGPIEPIFKTAQPCDSTMSAHTVPRSRWRTSPSPPRSR